MAETVTLRCTACGYENEPQRVYCHNCSTKLDRRLLPPEMLERQDSAEIERHVKKITDPRRGIFKRRVVNTCKSILFGAVIGLLACIFRGPETEPAPIPIDVRVGAPFIYDDLQSAMGQPTAKRFAYTQAQANGYLENAYRARDIDFYYIPLRYERTFVEFDEGSVDVTGQITCLWLPIRVGGRYAVTLRDKKIEARPLAGHFGRLNIPGPLWKYAGICLQPLWNLIDKDKRAVQQLNAITFRKGVVELQVK